MSQSGISLDQLDALVKKHKSKLESLTKQKKELEAKLATVDQEIGSLLSVDVGKSGRRGRPAGSTGQKKTVRRKRPKNKKSLPETVADILKGSKSGMSLQEVHDAVLKAGYKTKSKNFKNVVYQCLYHRKQFVQDDKTGNYKLKS